MNTSVPAAAEPGGTPLAYLPEEGATPAPPEPGSPVFRVVFAAVCGLAIVLTVGLLLSPGERRVPDAAITALAPPRTIALPASPTLVLAERFAPGDQVDILVAATEDHEAEILMGAEVVAVPDDRARALVVDMDDADVRSLLATIDGSLVIVTRTAA